LKTPLCPQNEQPVLEASLEQSSYTTSLSFPLFNKTPFQISLD